MGVVYEVLDREKNARVALKTLRRMDPDTLLRLKQEFRSLQDLEHPNLVGLGELIEEAGQWFFTMDLVDGTDFYTYVRNAPIPPAFSSSGAESTVLVPQDFLQSNGERHAREPELVQEEPRPRVRKVAVFDEARLRASLPQLVRGISALHDAGKIHRDIKPSNILVSHEGHLVLVDFGLVMDVAARAEKRAVGTMAFMAPEQAEGRAVGPAADWYGMGAVLYLSLTGAIPHDGDSLEEVYSKKVRVAPAPPSELVQNAPEDLSALCASLLHVDPAARPTRDEILKRLGTDRGPAASLSSQSHAAAPFVGRRREAEWLAQAYQESQAGGALTVVIRGESGVGKSALARRFLDGIRQNEPGTLVLSGRCYERELVPYKAFDGIIDGLSVHLSQLDSTATQGYLNADSPLVARLFPVLRRIPTMASPAEGPSLSPQELRSRALLGLRHLLSQVARSQRTVLFIDDLQWADADSLALLREAMHPPDAPPLLLLATLRAQPDQGIPEAILRVLDGLGRVRDISLSGLSSEEARDLIATLLVATDKERRPDVGSILEETGGHPLFIHELVRHRAEEDPNGVLAMRLDDALWARTRRLDSSAQRLLDLVAVSGGPVARKVVARAAAMAPAEMAKHVAVLRARYLVRTTGMRGVDSIEPYHDRVREAVVTHLTDESRKRYHMALAQALDHEGAGAENPLALLRHLLAAGSVARVADLAVRAAALASDALAFDQAAALYRMALDTGRYAPEEARRLRMLLADTLVHAGHGSEAADEYLLAADGAEHDVRIHCQRRAAQQLLLSGHVARGRSVLDAVLVDIGEALAPSPKRALLSLAWSRAKLRLRGLRWKARSTQDIPPAELSGWDVFRAIALGLGMVDNIRGADFQARCLLMALRMGEPGRIGQALTLEAVFQGSQGGRHLVRAAELLAVATRIAEETDDTYLRGWSMGVAGMLAYFEGRFTAAAQHFAQGEAILRQLPTYMGWDLSSVRLYWLLSLRQMGAFRELATSVGYCLREAARHGDIYGQATMTRALAIYRLVQDEPEEAKRDLSQAQWIPPEGTFHIQHFYEHRACSEISLYLGEDRADLEKHLQVLHAVERSLLLRVHTIRKEFLWLRGRLAVALAATISDGKGALFSLTEDMARRLERDCNPYSCVYSSMLLAGVAAGRGQADECKEHLRRAAARADERNYRFLAAAARKRLGERIGGDEGKALVAAAEAFMASEGIRNVEKITRMVLPGV